MSDTPKTDSWAMRPEHHGTPTMGSEWVDAHQCRQLERDLGYERESHETTKRMLADRDEEIERLRAAQPEGGALNDALELLRICREDCDLHYGNGEGARVGAFDTVAARVDDFLKRCTPQLHDDGH